MLRRALITAVLLLAVAGAMVLTGSQTEGTRGFCIDGPEGGYCETEKFVNWSGPLLFPTLLAGLVVIGLALWWLRRSIRWLSVAVAATATAVAFAVVGTLAF